MIDPHKPDFSEAPPVKISLEVLCLYLGHKIFDFYGSGALKKTKPHPSGLRQTQFVIPYTTRLRQGQFANVSKGNAANAVRLPPELDFDRNDKRDVTIWKLLDDGALQIAELLSGSRKCIGWHGLEEPPGVYESALVCIGDFWLRGITDYYIGTDQLLTRFDFLWSEAEA